MSRSDRLSPYKTKIIREALGADPGDGLKTIVRYHTTNVVEFDDDTITLRTGGWRSVTTLRKMSQASRQFDLGFSIYQRDFSWYVEHHGETIPFDDNVLVLDRAILPCGEAAMGLERVA